MCQKIKWLLIKSLSIISISAFVLCCVSCAPVVIAGAGAAVVGANVGGSSVDAKTTSNDKTIQFKAISLLRGYAELKNNSNVEPVVFNHIILLLGQVPSEQLRDALAERMAKIPGVKMVYNQLTIGNAVNIGGYLSDSWLTSKVITRMASSGINTLKFKIVSEKAVVYIISTVPRHELDAAANVVAETSGVTKVIKVYADIEPPLPAAEQ